MAAMTGIPTINRNVVDCERCPELQEYCAEVARTKRRAYRDHQYWGRPVPVVGDPRARLLVVGLAPGAHGANRTGRMFTGDRSGEWLFRALHRAGFSNQSESIGPGDGLELLDCLITNVCHCAPPKNKPTRDQLQACQHWFDQVIDAVPARVFVALGGLAWQGMAKLIGRREWSSQRLPKFSHGAMAPLAGNRWLVGSYHPSQQNTFTGRLTEEMFDEVFSQARSKLT